MIRDIVPSLPKGMCPVCSTAKIHKAMRQNNNYYECGCGYAIIIEGGKKG